MLRLPDLGANRQSIVTVEFSIVEGDPVEIQRVVSSSGMSFAVSNSLVDTASRTGKMVLTGWGNAFEGISKGLRLTCHDRSVIEVTDCRYVVQGFIDDLHPAEMSVMNHLLGENAFNKFVVPGSV